MALLLLLLLSLLLFLYYSPYIIIIMITIIIAINVYVYIYIYIYIYIYTWTYLTAPSSRRFARDESYCNTAGCAPSPSLRLNTRVPCRIRSRVHAGKRDLSRLAVPRSGLVQWSHLGLVVTSGVSRETSMIWWRVLAQQQFESHNMLWRNDGQTK